MAEISCPCTPGRQTLQDSGVNDGDEVGGYQVWGSRRCFFVLRPPFGGAEVG